MVGCVNQASCANLSLDDPLGTNLGHEELQVLHSATEMAQVNLLSNNKPTSLVLCGWHVADCLRSSRETLDMPALYAKFSL